MREENFPQRYTPYFYLICRLKPMGKVTFYKTNQKFLDYSQYGEQVFARMVNVRKKIEKIQQFYALFIANFY
jgi:hypothetical protein